MIIKDKMNEIIKYSERIVSDGMAKGIVLTSTFYGILDCLDNSKLDNPVLFWAPLLTYSVYDIYKSFKHGEDRGLEKLEKILGEE